MSYRTFYARRAAARMPVIAGSAPVIVSAIAAMQLVYINATNSGGVSATITLTEVLALDGSVLASAAGPSLAFMPMGGETLRVRQTLSLAGVTTTLTSSLVAVSSTLDGESTLLPMPVAANTSTYALTHVSQPGSRLYFIDPDPAVGLVPTQLVQSDMIYFWNGSAIIDSTGSTTGAGGVPYGTNPYNPTGPVKAWRHWAACGPTRLGAEPGLRTGESGSAFNPGATGYDGTGRLRSPDFWLFRRGRTLDLRADNQSYKTFATAWTPTGQSLATPGTNTGTQVVGVYGPIGDGMVKVQDPAYFGMVARSSGDWNNACYWGLHFDGSVRDQALLMTGADTSISSYSTTGSNVVVRDCLLDQCRQLGAPGPASASSFKLVRCAILDSHTRKLAINSAVDVHGTDTSMLEIVSTWISDGGHTANPRAIRERSFPVHSAAATYALGEVVQSADGTRAYQAQRAVAAGAALPADMGITADWMHIGLNGIPIGTVRNRNGYCASPVRIHRMASLRGGSGWQNRLVSKCSEVFWYAGYVAHGKGRASPSVSGDPDGSPLEQGYLRDSFLLRFMQAGTASNPGQGHALQMGLQDFVAERNIVSNAQYAVNSYAFAVVASGLETSGYLYGYPVRRSIIRNNIGECGTASFVNAHDGYDYQAAGYVAPGLVGNVASSNVCISSAVTQLLYTMHTSAPATTDTLVDGSNRVYGTRAAAAAAESYPDPGRTIKTWLQSLGVTVTSSDGVDEISDILSGRHAYTNYRPVGGGYWPQELSPVSLLNHCRAGWGQPALT